MEDGEGRSGRYLFEAGSSHSAVIPLLIVWRDTSNLLDYSSMTQ